MKKTLSALGIIGSIGVMIDHLIRKDKSLLSQTFREGEALVDEIVGSESYDTIAKYAHKTKKAIIDFFKEKGIHENDPETSLEVEMVLNEYVENYNRVHPDTPMTLTEAYALIK